MKKTFTLCRLTALWSLLLFAVSMLSATPAAAQSREAQTVSGRVTTTDGQAVVGGTVAVKGTTIGTATDINGSYTIRVKKGATLTFSYLSCKTEEIVVNSQTQLDVVLEEDNTAVETVVVVGYGVQKKVSLVGSVASVGTKEITQSSAPNLAASLSGRLPGLTAIQTGGQPGNDDVNLYIRGASTFSDGGASPLILIDGVPRNNMSSIDPSEIETISILKDASATAVFGVRGANGVILITTRRGKAGSMKVDISAKYSMTKPIYHIDRVHSWEFAHLRNEALANDGLAPEFSASQIEKYKQGNSPFYPDRDIMKEVFKDFASQVQVNANMSGGTERAQYFVSMGYLNQGSLYNQNSHAKNGYDPSFKYNRYNLRLNADYQLAKSLKASLNLGADIGEANSPLSGELTTNSFEFTSARIIDLIRKTRPVEPGPVSVAGYTDNNGNPVEAGVPVFGLGGYSVYGLLNDSGYTTRTRSNFNSSLSLDWDLSFITKGLSTKGMVAFDINGESLLTGVSVFPFSYKVDNPASGTYVYRNSEESFANCVELSRSYRSARRINLQWSVNYARTFAEKHNVTAMVLAQRDNWINAPTDFNSTTLWGESALPYNVIGLAARATYNYDDRYLAEINMGYNGSEQFSPNKRFGFFPAVSLGWIVSNERFMKDKTPITMLKFRGSYGKVGNDKQGSSRFLYMDNISVSSSGVFSSLGNGNGMTVALIGNNSLTWETEKKLNVGVDLDLKYGLFAKFDYYDNRREGILISRKSIPSFQGIPESAFPRLNEGKMKSWGYEAELGYQKQITQDLFVRFSGNLSFNDNKVLYSDEQYLGDDYAYPYHFDGFRLGQSWGYRIDYSNGNGYINTQEELDKYIPMYENGTIGRPTLGDFCYKDTNEDGVINDADKVPIGYSDIPRYSYGATLSATYKFIDFTIQIQGMAQFTAATWMSPSEAPNNYAGSYTGIHRQAWTQERYEAGEAILHPALHTSDSNASRQDNDFFMQDRSFTRLKLIELGFTLPDRWTKSIGMRGVRFSVSGQNLVRWDNLLFDNIDPEQTSSYAYPLSKIVTFNLNINF